ncbi:putative Yippee domain-containing protein [Helianthus annuus]|nr:putative Yippee domain-containing protein [Helianthus annuus]KAJ0619039.1 putative Yippee domain-containing protein [Helianthus annuus]KAJ0777492.1 putative Yippee domain-containing protein [Helianthus annuus]
MGEVVGPRLYSCCNCRNHVALHDDIISKAFQKLMFWCVIV